MSFFGEISTKQHYGLRLAICLAKAYHAKKSVSLKEVSDKEKISFKYLEQLVVPLKKSGLAKSERGRSGGYSLEKSPDKINLKEIIWLYSDKKYLVSCLAEKGKCKLEKQCLSKKVWSDVQNSIEKSLTKITLGDLIK